MQIAENVLVKLPSSMLLPEIRHTEQLKDTKISHEDGVSSYNDDGNSNTEETATGDMV